MYTWNVTDLAGNPHTTVTADTPDAASNAAWERAKNGDGVLWNLYFTGVRVVLAPGQDYPGH